MSVKLMGSLAGILVMRLEARLQLCSVTLFISRNTASGTWVSWHSLRSRFWFSLASSHLCTTFTT